MSLLGPVRSLGGQNLLRSGKVPTDCGTHTELQDSAFWSVKQVLSLPGLEASHQLRCLCTQAVSDVLWQVLMTC